MSKDRLVTLDGGAAGKPRDQIFADEQPLVKDFRFDSKTAQVFDDMVGRSVPFYAEIQRMIGEIAADFATPGSTIYDLGCATATTIFALDDKVDPEVAVVGIDNSAEMLAEAGHKLEAAGVSRPYKLIEADIEAHGAYDNASVVLMVLTLQFIRPLQRQRVLDKVFAGLKTDGCLILVEKLNFSATLLNRLFIKYYYDMKRRNGYSDVEISQKREALENVLVPYRPEENRAMLREVGFRHVEEFFRWYNFCGIIAVK